jgi:pimeloyl-ACP methyl ester carboxylesterase
MLLKLVLVSVAVLALYACLGAFWRRRFVFEPGYEEIHLVKTRDKWRIGLFRYPAAHKKHPTPVLLCHGLAANRFNFDLGPEVSLARYLQQEGFDVWSVDLRGRGNSGMHTDASAWAPHAFDDYVREDAVAALRHVQARTGASQVHWIGHSMGGLILYAVLQGEGAEAIASGVAIASPGTFARTGSVPLAGCLFQVLRHIPRIRLSFLAAGFAPLVARLPWPWQGFFLNRDNVEDLVVERALCHLVSDVSGGEIGQFLDWMKAGESRTHDGVHSYEKGLGDVRQPLFFVAGSKDFLAPAESVAAAYGRVGSNKKGFLVVGREHGQEEDYGHGDLLIGKNSSREVFPRILHWLESVEHDRQETRGNGVGGSRSTENDAPARP